MNISGPLLGLKKKLDFISLSGSGGSTYRSNKSYVCKSIVR